jgi:small subunit ribosomal protein S20
VANHKSAAKRARQSEVRTARNRRRRSSVRTALKGFREALSNGAEQETILKLFKSAQSSFATAATKGVYHKNNASRNIARMAQAFKTYLKTADEPASTTTKKKATTKKKVTAKKKTTTKKKAASKKKTTKKSAPKKS